METEDKSKNRTHLLTWIAVIIFILILDCLAYFLYKAQMIIKVWWWCLIIIVIISGVIPLITWLVFKLLASQGNKEVKEETLKLNDRQAINYIKDYIMEHRHMNIEVKGSIVTITDPDSPEAEIKWFVARNTRNHDFHYYLCAIRTDSPSKISVFDFNNEEEYKDAYTNPNFFNKMFTKPGKESRVIVTTTNPLTGGETVTEEYKPVEPPKPVEKQEVA